MYRTTGEAVKGKIGVIYEWESSSAIGEEWYKRALKLLKGEWLRGSLWNRPAR